MRIVLSLAFLLATNVFASEPEGTLLFEVQNYESDVKLKKKVEKQIEHGGLEWGVEDIDFSLRVWLLGYSILHDPAPVIGHRFRTSFDNYSVASESVTANQIRMARKNFGDVTWSEWLDRARDRIGAADWEKSWSLYLTREASVEAEREAVCAHRREDEFWYAERFGLEWPKKR